MILTAVLFGVSAWGSGIATSSPEFIVYRLLGGVGVGAASVLAPALISEIAPPVARGRLASLQQLGIVFGLFSAFLSNYLIAKAAGGAAAPWLLDQPAFRWMYWIEVGPAAAFLVGALLIPESPRFLVSAGRSQHAARVFEKISSENPEDRVSEVEKSLARNHRPSVRDLVDAGRVRPIVWVGVVLSIFQQFVGINVVFYYGEFLWRSVGFSESEALTVNVLSGGVNILSTFVAMYFVDKVGRKPLLRLGSAGMAVSLTVVAVALSTATLGESGLELSAAAGRAALLAANAYVFCFGASWGPVVWVLLGEMFNNQIRGAALSAGAGSQWVANFVITMSFPVLLSSFGVASAYALYALFAGLSFLFVGRFVQETRGRTLESM
jgi:SP family sugar:H+ symporter-like MFS transporter